MQELGPSCPILTRTGRRGPKRLPQAPQQVGQSQAFPTPCSLFSPSLLPTMADSQLCNQVGNRSPLRNGRCPCWGPGGSYHCFPQAWACSAASCPQRSTWLTTAPSPRCWPVRDAEPRPQCKPGVGLRNIESLLLCLESPSLPCPPDDPLTMR